MKSDQMRNNEKSQETDYEMKSNQARKTNRKTKLPKEPAVKPNLDQKSGCEEKQIRNMSVT